MKYEIEDTVVLALGHTPNATLYEELKDKSSDVYLVGDAMRTGHIVDAVYQANQFAREV